MTHINRAQNTITMKSLLLGCALALLLIQSSDAASHNLRCLHCNGVLNPLLCDRLKICRADEVCLTEKYRTENAEVLFNVGCYPAKSCVNSSLGDQRMSSHHLVSNLRPEDHFICSSCCQTNACNRESCLQDDTIPTSGPICYNCPQTTDPRNCSFVTTCEKNEMCRITKHAKLGYHYYSTACAAENDCHDFTGSILGKKREIDDLTRCCTYTLCNTDQTMHGNQVPDSSKPLDCLEVLHQGHRQSGVYTIYPRGKPVSVYCDMDTEGGGWTVIVSKMNDHLNFNRSWSEFKNGFGSSAQSYWIGNENIYVLSNRTNSSVYFRIESSNGTWFYAKYRHFHVSSEKEMYILSISSYSGTAGDSMSYSNGQRFTTFDMDNDGTTRQNCASYLATGWWYSYCAYSSFTGNNLFNGYRWYNNLRRDPLKRVFMMIKA